MGQTDTSVRRGGGTAWIGEGEENSRRRMHTAQAHTTMWLGPKEEAGVGGWGVGTSVILWTIKTKYTFKNQITSVNYLQQ